MTIDEVNESYRKIMEYYKKLVSIKDQANEYSKLEKLFEL